MGLAKANGALMSLLLRASSALPNLNPVTAWHVAQVGDSNNYQPTLSGFCSLIFTAFRASKVAKIKLDDGFSRQIFSTSPTIPFKSEAPARGSDSVICDISQAAQNPAIQFSVAIRFSGKNAVAQVCLPGPRGFITLPIAGSGLEAARITGARMSILPPNFPYLFHTRLRGSL